MVLWRNNDMQGGKKTTAKTDFYCNTNYIKSFVYTNSFPYHEIVRRQKLSFLSFRQC